MIIIQFNITKINDHDWTIFQDYDHPSMITIMKMVWNGINKGPIVLVIRWYITSAFVFNWLVFVLGCIQIWIFGIFNIEANDFLKKYQNKIWFN
jgi:hypothetical protein